MRTSQGLPEHAHNVSNCPLQCLEDPSPLPLLDFISISLSLHVSRVLSAFSRHTGLALGLTALSSRLPLAQSL